ARTPLSASLERLFSLPWNKGVGYETPGSFGSFSNDTGLGCVTLELPRESPEALSRFAEPFAEFLAAYGGDGK
ncbi:MAG: murein tripeptide amidase MpaA, partial [Fibrobacteraceae bacterium]